MKPIIALIIASLLFALPALADAAQQAPTPDSADGAVMPVPLERARYHFEHSALPRYFYEDPATMLDVMGSTGAYRLWCALADENGVAYPYLEEDFSENRFVSDGGTVVMQVVLPKPEVSGQCWRVYFVYDPGTGAAGYYTAELEDLLGEACMICGWTKDRVHANYGGAPVLDPGSDDYGAGLLSEASHVAELAGVSGALKPDDGAPATVTASGLEEISCPEMGFTTMADPAFSRDYKDGTGVTIYTGHEGSIPYVIVYQSEDLIAEAFEYIREQYTPHIQKQYGDDLVFYQEYEAYSLGGKQLPAGVYTYRLQGHLIDLIRVYDSTGERTAIFTAKYIQGQAEPTLSALHDAIRYFRAD